MLTETTRDPPSPGKICVHAVHSLLHPGVLRAGDHHVAGEHRLLGQGGRELGVDRHVVHHPPPYRGGARVSHHPAAALLEAGLTVAGQGEVGLGVDLAGKNFYSHFND